MITDGHPLTPSTCLVCRSIEPILPTSVIIQLIYQQPVVAHDGSIGVESLTECHSFGIVDADKLGELIVSYKNSPKPAATY